MKHGKGVILLPFVRLLTMSRYSSFMAWVSLSLPGSTREFHLVA